MYRIATIVLFSALVLPFSGCATSSSAGDQMIQRASSAKTLGKQWNKGERMVKKGERLLASAEKLASNSDRDSTKSKKMLEEGKKLVEQGNQMMDANQAEFVAKFPEQDVIQK